jgi:hypothetical protein
MCVAPPWPFSISQSHSCNSCSLAIAFGSDKQSKCCCTHRVIVIAMKSKGNNNKPVLKVVTTKTLQLPKRYHSADVYLTADTATSQFIRNFRAGARKFRAAFSNCCIFPQFPDCGGCPSASTSSQQLATHPKFVCSNAQRQRWSNKL